MEGSYLIRKKGKLAERTTRRHSFAFFVTRCTTRCHPMYHLSVFLQTILWKHVFLLTFIKTKLNTTSMLLQILQIEIVLSFYKYCKYTIKSEQNHRCPDGTYIKNDSINVVIL